MKYTPYLFYVLQDPQTNEIGYVGMTTEVPSVRLSKHVSEAMKTDRHSPKNVWIRELIDKGVKPLINQIEVSGFATFADAGIREQYWIAKYKEDGHPLRNATIGGPGTTGLTFQHSEETKNKITEQLKTTKNLEEAIEARREGKSWARIAELMQMSRKNFDEHWRPKIEAALSAETENGDTAAEEQ